MRDVQIALGNKDSISDLGKESEYLKYIFKCKNNYITKGFKRCSNQQELFFQA